MTYHHHAALLTTILITAVGIGCGEDAGGEGAGATSGSGAAAGSGNGAGGEGGTVGPDPNPATVELVFPPGVGSTTRESLVVRGLATDPEGVASVTVNGAEAVLDGDAWQATVDLPWGRGALSITVVDDAGYSSTTELGDIERAAPFGASAPPIFHDGKLYTVAGNGLDGGWLVEHHADGTRRGIAEFPKLTVPSYHNTVFAVDASGGRLVHVTAEGVTTYDIATGSASVVTTNDGDSGASFDWPRAVAVDEANNRAIIVDDAASHLVAVDLSNGDKSVFVEPFMAVFESARCSTYDRANERILIVDEQQVNTHGQLLSYRLSDGDRNVLSFSGLDEIDITFGCSMTTDGDTAWIVTRGTVVKIDLSTGERTYFAQGFSDPTLNGKILQPAYGADALHFTVSGGRWLQSPITNLSLTEVTNADFPGNQPPLHHYRDLHAAPGPGWPARG